MEKEKIKPDFKIVHINETNDWDLTGELECVEKITGCYIADFSRNTYCCELTPSLYLIWMAYDEEFKEGVEEQAKEVVDGIIADQIGEDGYYHRSYIENSDKIIVKDVDWDNTDWMEEFDYSTEEGYYELIEEARELISYDGCY